MSEEIMRAIRTLYEELKQRKEEANKTIDMLTDDWHGYREYHRAIGRALGLDEAINLIEKDVLKRWEGIPEDDYTEASYS